MEKYKKIWPLLLVFEVIICLVLIAAVRAENKNQTKIETSLSDWQSKYITYDNGWYVDESLVQTDKTIDLINGPYLAMKRGTYSVKIDYECNSNQTCMLKADKVSDEILKTGLNQLSKNQTSISFRFTLMDDVDNLEAVVKYSGQGSLRINNIEIVSNAIGIQRMAVIILFLFGLLDFCICFRHRIDENRNLIMTIVGIAFLASIPLFMKGIHYGHDTQFHLMRIEGIAQEIRRGNVPVKMSSLHMDGYGYPVSVYYGDLLLYIPAILRIIGFTITTAYKIYVLLVNLATSIVSYVCFKQIFHKKDIALLTSLAYVTAGYRIVNLYLRFALGEYSAMIFLPVVALALYKIYTDDSNEWRLYKKHALILALGMTGLIGTHVLSTEMVCFVMILLCAALWKKTFTKNTIQIYGLAVLETIVLNLYFIIPFLDYYMNVDVAVNHKMEEGVMRIQKNGAEIGEYFAFFQNIFGKRMGMTPGTVLILFLLLSVVLWVNKKATKQMKLYTVFSVLLLFMATKSFPWDYLAAHSIVGRLLAQVQFPWRYIGLAIIMLTMLLGSILQYFSELGQQEVYKKLYIFTAGVCIVMAASYASNYADTGVVNFCDTAELDTYKTGSLYIRTGTNKGQFLNAISGENMAEISSVSRIGSHMELYCRASDDAEGSVEVPFLNYKGYHVRDENGTEYEIVDGNNNVVKFSVPRGFAGRIIIDFIQPWYWRAGEVLSLIFAVFLVAKWMIFKEMRKKDRNKHITKPEHTDIIES